MPAEQHGGFVPAVISCHFGSCRAVILRCSVRRLLAADQLSFGSCRAVILRCSVRRLLAADQLSFGSCRVAILRCSVRRLLAADQLSSFWQLQGCAALFGGFGPLLMSCDMGL